MSMVKAIRIWLITVHNLLTLPGRMTITREFAVVRIPIFSGHLNLHDLVSEPRSTVLLQSLASRLMIVEGDPHIPPRAIWTIRNALLAERRNIADRLAVPVNPRVPVALDMVGICICIETVRGFQLR